MVIHWQPITINNALPSRDVSLTIPSNVSILLLIELERNLHNLTSFINMDRSVVTHVLIPF